MALTREYTPEGKEGSAKCIHCSRGWTYHEDEDTGEETTIPCWMCDTLDANHSCLERA